MSKTLFIVESPTKAKSIGKYFPEFEVMATVGHFRDLPVNELGVDTNTHKPTYVTTEGKSDLVKRLKSASRTANEIILATDPDREGETIAAHVAFILGREIAPKIHRVVYQEVTKTAIQNALKHKRPIDWRLVKAQEGRRVLDRYVGYLVSPVLTEKFRTVQWMNYLSAGRVQSVALRLVVERAEEIENFKPIEHYAVVAHLTHANQNFCASWIRLNAENQIATELMTDRALAQQVVARTRALKLYSIEKTKVKVSPPAPLTTSSYVKLVSSRFKITTKQAMECAQKLFEQGLITYHRTDSPYMSEDFALQVRAYASSNQLPLPHSVRQFRAKAGAQEAHECLRVTDIHKAKVLLEDDQLQLIYRAIWELTLGSQLADGIDERTGAFWVNQSNDHFLSRGRVIIDPGFRRVKTLGLEELDGPTKEPGDHGAEQSLPALSENLVLKPSEVEEIARHTKPPSLFSEVSLVAKLESLAVGRPSTYASVIETIVKRGYVERGGKSLIFTPTPTGRAVVMALRPVFSFLNYSYTADAETHFDLIAQGKSSYDTVVSEAYKKLTAEIAQFNQRPLTAETVQAINALPAPTATTAKPTSKSKKNTSSTKVDNPTSHKKQDNAAPCPKCNKGKLLMRTVKSGDRAGSHFLGCSNYPECRHAENIPSNVTPNTTVH